jgi:transcriptional regulator with XRE-family HTH domain
MLSMLSGPALATAFTEAMRLKKEKGVTQQQVAEVFGVRQASVSEWGKTGRIAKKHLNTLVEYFSDVVEPEHWGLHESIQDAMARAKYPDAVPRLSPTELDLVAAFRQLPDDEQQELVRDVMARAETLNQLVQRVLRQRGMPVSGYVTATRAAEHLPPAPTMPAPGDRRTGPQIGHNPERRSTEVMYGSDGRRVPPDDLKRRGA